MFVLPIFQIDMRRRDNVPLEIDFALGPDGEPTTDANLVNVSSTTDCSYKQFYTTLDCLNLGSLGFSFFVFSFKLRVFILQIFTQVAR